MDSSRAPRPVLSMRWELTTGADGRVRPVARWVAGCPAVDQLVAEHPVAEQLRDERPATPSVVPAA